MDDGTASPASTLPRKAATVESDAERQKRLHAQYNRFEEETRSTDPTDINGSAFDASAYTAQLFKEKKLKGLMAQDALLIKEIKHIDSEMKTLVYENYNKLIHATDTIGHMKKDVDAMAAQMDQMQKMMDEIAKTSDDMNTAFAARKSTLYKLNQLQAKLASEPLAT